ncbi:MAG: hypothetical protein R3308_06305, partial [Thiohalobacterales bacterium]|nr:hypothetical protein [Thiohalobacterales bacterium]
MILLVPFSQDPLAAAARRILDHYQEQLPDLSTCQVLVADTQCAAALRAALLDECLARGFKALLGPHIDRLDTWLLRFGKTNKQTLQRPAQELILGEALRQAEGIYANTDPWLLADQLLVLFEELTLNQVPVPESLDDFERSLQQAYGLPQPSAVMQQEAYILHTLWHAWRDQLEAENFADPASAHLECLRTSLQKPLDEDLWLIGFTEFSPAEIYWLKSLLIDGRA